MKAILYFTRLEENHSKQQEHQAGEALLAWGLEKEYGISFSPDQIEKGEHGKPYLGDYPDIHYNISHSACLAVCAFAPVPIGIDVQKHKKIPMEPMLERTVPAKLAKEILATTDGDQPFFTQWVLREAYIKWTGEGLSKDMRTIDMEEGWHTLLNVDKGYSGAIWSGSLLEIEWRYVAPEMLGVTAWNCAYAGETE